MPKPRRLNPTVLLVSATAAALLWANSPWSTAYEDLWHGWAHTLVNDGLMSVFFLAIGIEVKRELAEGELRDRRHAAVPAIAAVGGMVVPAALYYAIARDGGWGVPMATDIAFAVGVVSALGRRVPRAVVVFLLTLAVVDDIGAIVVILLFYSEGGIHPPLVAVAAGLLLPVRWTRAWERPLTRVSTLLVLPVFAFANAGVSLDGAAATPVTVGIVVGLVAGKTLGITAAAWAAVRLGIGRLPDGATWRHLVGVGLVAGIGFTVSLFVAGLAYADPATVAEAKVGILAASSLAAAAGAVWLARS